MIQVEGLTIAFQGTPLFTNATFSIQEGEHCGFVGRNGSGKTTLFRILTGKESPDQGIITLKKNYTIGALSQHIHFTHSTVIDEAASALRSEDSDKIYQAEKILFGLGFKEADMDKSPSSLSGGYQLRLHLAKVLISEPNCLLLDEPTNYLDILSIRWLTRFLRQWKGEFIVISHDREFMDSVSTHTMGIHREEVRKVKGTTIDFYEQILQEEEIHERTRANLEKKRSHAQSFIDRFGAKATKAAQAQSRRKMIERIPVLERLKDIHQLDFHFNEAPFQSQKVLETNQLCFSYNPQAPKPLVDHLSIQIENGERVAIIGKNGFGKSTILRLLAGELSPGSGQIKWAENIKIGYFGQTNIDRLHPRHTIEEEISLSNPQLNRTEVKALCGLMMFGGDKASKTTSILSGGEKSRVLLGKILASPCNLLLLDEPTHHLDIESVEALIDAMEDFEGAIVLVTHSELILKRLSLDKLIVCHQGKQELFLGGYDEFLEKKGWEEESEDQAHRKTGSTYKETKQQRAEQVAARSKALKPILLEIAATEKKITTLELEQDQANVKLIEASQARNSLEIQTLSKALSERKKLIDTLYEKLEELLRQQEKVK